MLFLEYFFLPCVSEIEVNKNNLTKGSATCIIEKSENDIDFYISENMEIDEVFFTRGGTNLYYEKKESENGLNGWFLPSIPEGNYEITINYSGLFAEKNNSYHELDMEKGILPLSLKERKCTTVKLKNSEIVIANSLQDPNALIYLCDVKNKIFQLSGEEQIIQAESLKIITTKSKTIHQSWINNILEKIKKIESELNFFKKDDLVLLEGKEWLSQKGVIVVPENYLENDLRFSEISKHLAYQWENVKRPIENDPLGRIVHSYIDEKTTALSRRISDRAHLEKTNGKDTLRLQSVFLEYEKKYQQKECSEIFWPFAKLSKTKVARLADGYETSIYFDWSGKCSPILNIKISNSKNILEKTIVLKPQISVHKITSKWIPRNLEIDSKGFFPGGLERDKSTPLLFESLASKNITEWIQPTGTIASLGPGGAFWPDKKSIQLPDGTLREWTQESLLLIASKNETFLISANKRKLPEVKNSFLDWGWVFFEEEIPVRWGTNTGSKIYKLPIPEIFSWGD